MCSHNQDTASPDSASHSAESSRQQINHQRNVISSQKSPKQRRCEAVESTTSIWGVFFFWHTLSYILSLIGRGPAGQVVEVGHVGSGPWSPLGSAPESSDAMGMGADMTNEEIERERRRVLRKYIVGLLSGAECSGIV